MYELLEALGWRPSFSRGLALAFLVAGLTGALLVGALALAQALSVSVVLVQVVLWLVWLAWLGFFFPRNWQRDWTKPCARPYRRAFRREILFGICIAFSQLLRPALVGAHANGSVALEDPLALGPPVVLAGGVLIAAGAHALGIARTLFVHEYVAAERQVVKAGIYRLVRHPLFLGGAMISLGLALWTGEDTAIALGLINACIAPVYAHLEDRRCSRILGPEYAHYRATVGGVLPRRRSAMRLVAQVHQADGRIEPIAGRADVNSR